LTVAVGNAGLFVGFHKPICSRLVGFGHHGYC
jgi:hypothetical protein